MADPLLAMLQAATALNGMADTCQYLKQKEELRQNATALIATRLLMAELIEEHRALYLAYVNTLESGRDRIVELGGTCDHVDVMEQNDPRLIQSRRLLARIGGANG